MSVLQEKEPAMRRILCCSIAFVAVCAGRADAQCCGLDLRPRSVLDGFFDAKIVAVCRLQNAVEPDNALPEGQVEFTLDGVVVPHALVKGKKSIVIPRFRGPTKEKYLVAMDVDKKGVIDPYMGAVLDGKGEMERFVVGALKLKDKTPPGRARYAVDFLLSSNSEVVASAVAEVSRLEYADLRKLAETLKPEPWLKALQDDKTPAAYVGTYAVLLGHCGKKEHAAVLRKLLDDKERPQARTTNYLLIAYVLLDRDNGWQLVCDRIEHKDTSFLSRYAALQTARFMHQERQDVIAEKKSLAAIAGILKTPNMADFAIEDLRKLKRWEYCDAILELPGKDGFGAPVLRHAVLRFALQCPSPAAKTYVQIALINDPERVAEVEELLALESKDEVGPKK
jgi:hypothetical protein